MPKPRPMQELWKDRWGKEVLRHVSGNPEGY
jgi:hypothetical protein